MFVISFIQVILIGLIDALIKGNVVSYYNNWSKVPWYLKDENLIYPLLIAALLFLTGFFLTRWCRFGWKYLAHLAIWAAGGLESLGYWFWIALLPIGQNMWWLPDSSLFWWYPRNAPWLNNLMHLKWISQADNVTREGVLAGVAIAFVINASLVFMKKQRKQKPNDL